MLAGRPRRRGGWAFIRDCAGSISVEFVVWMPVFLIILAMMADGASLFIRQANMWNVARDTARGMAVGQLTTCTNSGTSSDAQTFALGQLLFGGKNYTVSCWFPGKSATSCANSKSTTNPTSTDDIVEICIPIQDAGIFGVLAVYGGMSGSSFNVQVSMLSEV